MIRRGRQLAQRLSAGLPRARRGTVVLAYHLVGAGTGSPVDLPRDDFRRQLEQLQGGRRRVLPLAAALDRVAGGTGVEPEAETKEGAEQAPAAVLTFDDAYDNFRTHAWPLLREAGLPATLFVPVGFLDGSSPPPLRGAALPALGWDALRELADEGLDVGSHSLTHPDLRSLPDDRLAEEMAGSRRRLEDALERPVSSFAYPRALWDRRVEAAAAAAGYDVALGAGGRPLRRDSLRRPHRLPRVPVRSDLAVPFDRLLDAPVWIEEWLADRVRRR